MEQLCKSATKRINSGHDGQLKNAMMNKELKILNVNSNDIFSNGFLCGKNLFVYCFGLIPSANYIWGIDGEKAFNAIRENYADLIDSVHSYRRFDRQKGKYNFDETFVIMKNGCVMEFDSNYCEIFHSGTQGDFINECTLFMRKYKERQKRKPLEINLVKNGRDGFELHQIEIKRTKLDIELFYEADFKAVHELIYNRLMKKEDKGIILLHGLPGTGKTTYLRHLIGKIKKRVLFLSPNLASEITDPSFVKLLVSNPNTVLIIEDAEKVIMDRSLSGSASVSNLLNISDGLLADFLNIQIICTFNSNVAMVDAALMRKGRLIASYEFGKLSQAKAQRLSDRLALDQVVDRPMTLAEITHPHDKAEAMQRPRVAGFRREVVEMN